MLFTGDAMYFHGILIVLVNFWKYSNGNSKFSGFFLYANVKSRNPPMTIANMASRFVSYAVGHNETLIDWIFG